MLKQQELDHKATKEVLYNIISSDPGLSGEFALNVSQVFHRNNGYLTHTELARGEQSAVAGDDVVLSVNQDR